MKNLIILVAIFIVASARGDGIGWADDINSYSLTYNVDTNYTKLPICGGSTGDELPIPYGTVRFKSKEFLLANYPLATWIFKSIEIVKPSGSPKGACVFIVKFENTEKKKNNKFYVGMNSDGSIFPPKVYPLTKPSTGLRP